MCAVTKNIPKTLFTIKKILFILFSSFLFSCSSEFEKDYDIAPKNDVLYRTPEEAIAIAENFVTHQEQGNIFYWE